MCNDDIEQIMLAVAWGELAILEEVRHTRVTGVTGVTGVMCVQRTPCTLRVSGMYHV